MDGPERLRVCGKGVGWTGGLVLRLLTALNGRPRAMTSSGCGEGGEVVKGCKGVRLISLKTALNGRPRDMKRLEGVWEGSREGDDGNHS